MTPVLPTESVINPGTNIEVLDHEPVTKHKKSKRSPLDEFCRNAYNFCTTCCAWVSLEVGGLELSNSLTQATYTETSSFLQTNRCSNLAGALSGSFCKPWIDDPFLN